MEKPRLLENTLFAAQDITSKVRAILPMIAVALLAATGCKEYPSPEAIAQATLDECTEALAQSDDSLSGLTGYCKKSLREAGILEDPENPRHNPFKTGPVGNCNTLIKELGAKGIECDGPFTRKEDGTTITCRDMGDPGTDEYSTGYQINCTQ